VKNALQSFAPLDADSIKKIIMKAKTTSCTLDPLPCWLLKKCITSKYFLDSVASIVNSTLTSKVPDAMKEAVVRPKLKKPDLDTNNLKNYRPISYLSFISKIIERVVAQQLTNFIEDNQLLDKHQSAYRAYHSFHRDCSH
jgi:hypothetical protein